MGAALIFLLVTVVLFFGFFALTVVEAQTGTRLLGKSRTKLDRFITRIWFVVEHVNWSEFLSYMIQSVGARIVHDVAHRSLMAVRAAERQLTSIVRYLRDSRPNTLAPSPTRKSIVQQTLQYLRNTLHIPEEKKKK